MKSLPLRLGIDQECVVSSLLFLIVSEILTNAVKHDLFFFLFVLFCFNIRIGIEEIKLSLLQIVSLCYIENSKYSLGLFLLFLFCQEVKGLG